MNPVTLRPLSSICLASSAADAELASSSLNKLDENLSENISTNQRTYRDPAMACGKQVVPSFSL